MARLFRIRVMMFLMLSFGALVLNIGLSQGDGFYRQYRELQDSEMRLQLAMRELEQKNQSLDLELARLRESKSYAERVLKDKYHVRKENEVILFFDD